MKSCKNYSEVLSIKNKTLIISIVFVVLLAVLYYVYNSKNNNNIHSQNLKNNNQDKLINKYQNQTSKLTELLRKGTNLVNDTQNLSLNNNIKRTNDNFEDIILFDNLTPEQKEIVKTHRHFFNEPTKDAITKFYDENANNIDKNLAALISRYNEYSQEVDNTIQEINYDLLRQLQSNYALAHKVNIKRNIELEDIDNLPQRFD
jgi:hypothetical protein